MSKKKSFLDWVKSLPTCDEMKYVYWGTIWGYGIFGGLFGLILLISSLLFLSVKGLLVGLFLTITGLYCVYGMRELNWLKEHSWF